MMNPFPIMFLSLLAHAVLRVVAGSILIVLGIRRQQTLHEHPQAPWILLALVSLTEIVVGAMLIAGFMTQIAALVLLGYGLLTIALHRRVRDYVPTLPTYVLLVGIALSLFITGAGAFAFDVPF